VSGGVHRSPPHSVILPWIAGVAGHVAVAIEAPHGPVVDPLVDRGFAMHVIKARPLRCLRDRLNVAGAEDDRWDAYALADGIRTDRRLFRRLYVANPKLVELRGSSRLFASQLRSRGDDDHRDISTIPTAAVARFARP
jgi:hypothetical protein